MALRDVIDGARPAAGIDPDRVADEKEIRAVRTALVEIGPRVTIAGAPDGAAGDLGNEPELLEMVSAAARFCKDREDVARIARVDAETFDELGRLCVALGQVEAAAAPLEDTARLGCLVLSADLTQKTDRVRAAVQQKTADESTPLAARRALAARFGTERLLRGAARGTVKGRRERFALHRAKGERRIGEGVAEVGRLLREVDAGRLATAAPPAALKRSSRREDKTP